MEFSLIPTGLSEFSFYALIVLSCFTSMLTVAVGMGGGTVLLAVMAQLLPVKAIIPVHGVVQLGSNLGRALLLMPHIQRDLLAWFLLGSVLGALLGGQVVVSLPVALLQGVLGIFILFTVWGPAVRSLGSNSRALAVGGFLSTLLTMFVGATGPFVVALLRAFSLKPQTLVATTAVCLVIQHLLKVVVFGVLGFAYSPYLPLIILMLISGFAGTLIGRRILIKVDEVKFQRGLNIILSLLALRLIIVALI